MRVSEVFGPVWQGEGPSAGQRAAFVRLGGCNLDCGAGEGATWTCDTPYTWDWLGKLGEPQDRLALRAATPTMVAAEVAAMDVDLVVVTGGEPMLQQRAVLDLLLAVAPARVEVETNGTRRVEDGLLLSRARWNVSPKLANSGVPEARRIVPDVLRQLAAAGAVFKFVCSTPADVGEADAIRRLAGVGRRDVWVMPGGVDSPGLLDVARGLAPAVEAHRFNLSLRQHVLLWGNERGR